MVFLESINLEEIIVSTSKLRTPRNFRSYPKVGPKDLWDRLTRRTSLLVLESCLLRNCYESHLSQTGSLEDRVPKFLD